MGLVDGMFIGFSSSGVDPAVLSALVDLQTAPLLDVNTLTQLSQLNELLPPTTPKPATTAAPAKSGSTINLSIGRDQEFIDCEVSFYYQMERN